MNAFCYGVRRQSAATTALLLEERIEGLGRRSHSAVVAALCPASYTLFVRQNDLVARIAKSSVRSAMFIARRPPKAPAKLRRSGMGRTRESNQRTQLPHAAPTELGWTHRPLLAINMALLTELFAVTLPFAVKKDMCKEQALLARPDSLE